MSDNTAWIIVGLAALSTTLAALLVCFRVNWINELDNARQASTRACDAERQAEMLRRQTVLLFGFIRTLADDTPRGQAQQVTAIEDWISSQGWR